MIHHRRWLTCAVPGTGESAVTGTTPRLQPGAEIRCPHCRRWHPVISKHTDGTEYTRAMLYWLCRSATYDAGQLGGNSRYPTRRAEGSRRTRGDSSIT